MHKYRISQIYKEKISLKNIDPALHSSTELPANTRQHPRTAANPRRRPQTAVAWWNAARTQASGEGQGRERAAATIGSHLQSRRYNHRLRTACDLDFSAPPSRFSRFLRPFSSPHSVGSLLCSLLIPSVTQFSEQSAKLLHFAHSALRSDRLAFAPLHWCADSPAVAISSPVLARGFRFNICGNFLQCACVTTILADSSSFPFPVFHRSYQIFGRSAEF